MATQRERRAGQSLSRLSLQAITARTRRALATRCFLPNRITEVYTTPPPASRYVHMRSVASRAVEAAGEHQ